MSQQDLHNGHGCSETLNIIMRAEHRALLWFWCGCSVHNETAGYYYKIPIYSDTLTYQVEVLHQHVYFLK